MRKELLSLKKDISLISCKNNLVCVLIYGSILKDDYKADDLDVIIVVKKVDSTLNEIFKLFSNVFNKLDIHTYSQEEISQGLSFYSREFILEYLANEGMCIFGNNIFKNEFLNINAYQYKQSMLIRSIERIQMVRKKYFISSVGQDEKLKYLKKYFLRISKSILILENKENNDSLKNLTQEEVNQKLFTSGVLDFLIDSSHLNNLDDCFNLFDNISNVLTRCKKNIET
ncbi:MAG: hypothetical protein NTU81_01635 [Candidatus Nomurabacteria bacterium]|nr:hypothetical protein [Candidatus Nomurabacteria bacterium]